MDPVISADGYKIFFSRNWDGLNSFLTAGKWSGILVITDRNTERTCLPLFRSHLPQLEFKTFSIPAGEENKNLNSCRSVWEFMLKEEADRESLVINLGGGMVGDLGGFCAATFKRGLTYIHLPSSLLAQVDASVGGKLGVDLHTVKNAIGCFQDPEAVFIFPEFLHTLPQREFESGAVEISKHALIASIDLWNRITEGIPGPDDEELSDIIREAVQIKVQIVKKDPKEKGIRKALNFGHTIGHALESHFLKSHRHLLHGEAVGIGIICESWISLRRELISRSDLEAICKHFSGVLGLAPISEKDFPALLSLIRQDKKNQFGKTGFTLLSGIGQCLTGQEVDEEEIIGSLNFYRDLK